MNQYKVLVTDEALSDMESIYEYIAEELIAPDTAMEQYNRIADALETFNYALSGHRSHEVSGGRFSSLYRTSCRSPRRTCIY